MSDMIAGARGLARVTFGSFRARNYRLWVAGQSISMVGFWVQLVAQALLVLRLTESGTILGIAAALQFLPILVVGPWAGLLCDRLDKRRLLMVTQAVMMGAAFALGVLELTGNTTLQSVLFLAGLTGIAFAFDQPARRTIVTELVVDADAANAVSLNGAIGNAAKILGPAVASLLISTVGIGWCFVLNGATSVAVLLSLVRMDTAEIRRQPTLERRRGQIREGFSYAWSDTDVRTPLLMLTPVAIFAFNWNVLLPLLAIRDLRGTAATYGLLMGVMSIGAVAGTLWLARRPVATNRFLARCCASLGVASLALALAPTLTTAALACVAVGATSMVLFNGSVVGMQLGTDPALRGRVMATFSMVFLGSHALGAPFSGWIAERIGARAALGLGGVASLVVGIIVLAALRGRPAIGHAASSPVVETVPPPGQSRNIPTTTFPIDIPGPTQAASDGGLLSPASPAD